MGIHFKKLGGRPLRIIGIILAVANILFAVAWLFRVDLLLPALAKQLAFMDNGTNYPLAIIALVLAVLGVIISIPFLLGMNLKSKLFRLISGIFAVVPALVWTCVAIWSLGGVGGLLYVGPAVQFTTYAPFSANWAVLVADILWLIVSVYTIWAMGVEEIYPNLLKKDRKDKKAEKAKEAEMLESAKASAEKSKK